MSTCPAALHAIVLLLWLPDLVAAMAFSDLVVFGDSLSDVGNLSLNTSGLFPGPSYFEGRASNGPLYVETLAAGLGLSAVLPSSVGGNNFAHIGAQTTGTGGLEGLFIQDVNEQVDAFLDSRVADPQALFLIFAGADDLTGGETDVSMPVANLANDITRLHAAGTRRLLVMNLPPLGDTPEFNGDPARSDQFNELSHDFNDALDTTLDSLAGTLADLRLWRFDVAGAFGQATADPAAFGLTNVSDSAAPGLIPGDPNYNSANIVADPDRYLFWDFLHPTATGHRLLAEQVLAALLSDLATGDYNSDGVVNAADYTVWRDTLGESVPNGTGADGDSSGEIDQADFEIWKGQYAIAQSVSGTTAPEPPAATVLLIGWVFSITSMRPVR